MKNRFLSAVLLTAICLSLCLPVQAASSTEITPDLYDSVGDFSEGLAAVKRNGKWGYIDEAGRQIVSCIYDSARNFSEGVAAVEQGGKWGYIDKTGATAVPMEYDAVDSFSEGLAAVRRNWKYGYIDRSNTMVVALEYDAADSFSEGLARVERDGKWGCIDRTGGEVVPCVYDEVNYFSEGLAAVKRNGKWGFIDRAGRQVVPGIYDSVRNFSGGLAVVERNGKWGYVAAGDVPSDLSAGSAAHARMQTVELNGRALALPTYALKDESGNETNYVRLRDIAYMLKDTAAMFRVDEDGAVSITTKTAYAPDGSEMKTLFTGDRAYRDSTTAVRIDGMTVSLRTIELTDDNGGECTYFKLRDLSGVIGFTVDWSAERGIVIATGN